MNLSDARCPSVQHTFKTRSFQSMQIVIYIWYSILVKLFEIISNYWDSSIQT